MHPADLFTLRPRLTSDAGLTHAIEAIGRTTTSQAEVWKRLTEHYVVDLDAVAALVPCAEPEPVWPEGRT